MPNDKRFFADNGRNDPVILCVPIIRYGRSSRKSVRSNNETLRSGRTFVRSEEPCTHSGTFNEVALRAILLPRRLRAGLGHDALVETWSVITGQYIDHTTELDYSSVGHTYTHALTALH